jgi:hypothetical protein
MRWATMKCASVYRGKGGGGGPGEGGVVTSSPEAHGSGWMTVGAAKYSADNWLSNARAKYVAGEAHLQIAHRR